MASRVFSLSLINNDQQNKDGSLMITKEVPLLRDRPIRQIACGGKHTVFVLADGTVYTYKHDGEPLDDEKEHPTLERISSLDTFFIVQAACGDVHSVVISDKGRIMSWGHDNEGQCGRGKVNMDERPTPRVIKSLSKQCIVQVASGSKHTLALTKNGKLFAWGDNSYCQLGFSTHPEPVCPVPTEVTCLAGLPIKQISCGGDHSLALTFSGTVFGWGGNKHGQLGKCDEKTFFRDDGDQPDGSKPLHPVFKAVWAEKDTIKVNGMSKLIETKCQSISAMSEYKDKSFEELRYEYNVTSTVPHKLDFLQRQQIANISCGQNHSVFLTKNGEVISRGKDFKDANSWSTRVVELTEEMDKKIMCGKLHSMLFLPSRDELYVFGPTPLEDHPSTFNNHSSLTVYKSMSSHINADTLDSSVRINNVYCGGLFCYLVASELSKIESIPDSINYRLDEEAISRLAALPPSKDVPQEMLRVIQNLFSSSTCLNRSFLSDDQCCSDESHGLDLTRARKAFKRLSEKHKILAHISHVVDTQLCPTLSVSPLDPEALRVYLLLLEFPTMQYPELYLQSIFSVSNALCKLSPKMSEVIDTWLGTFTAPHFQHLVTLFQNVVVYYVLKQIQVTTFMDPKDVLSALDMLKKLYKINEEMDEIIPYTLFYVPQVKLLFRHWRQHKLSVVNFIEYPSVLENDVKMNTIIWDNIKQQHKASVGEEMWMFHQLICPDIPPNLAFLNPLTIIIDRQNLMNSTREQLNREPNEFKKPLVVRFIEEPVGGDGPSKDFFRLILKEFFDPQFGMFKVFSEKTQRIWFNPQTFEDQSMFRLVGTLCGLAIYNQVIVDLPFPLALYKKLLNKRVNLSDLGDLDPTMARSFKDTLDYNKYKLQDLYIYFVFSSEYLGLVRTVDLKEGGSTIQVTLDNKQEYVDRYIDYMFHESIAEKYEAFAEGFLEVCGGPMLEMFHPKELMAMVIGNEVYDWEEFERLAVYEGVFSKDHKTIKFFWDVFHEFTLEEKKKFLEFLSGSDRIPIQGMSHLKPMTIMPMVVSVDRDPTTNHTVCDREFLPAALTCHSILLLPLYESKEQLKLKLTMTLEFAQGFGTIHYSKY